MPFLPDDDLDIPVGMGALGLIKREEARDLLGALAKLHPAWDDEERWTWMTLANRFPGLLAEIHL